LTTTNESFKPLLLVRGPENKSLYHIQTNKNKEVFATEGHPFVSINNRILISKELKVGTVLQTLDGPEIVTKVSQSIKGKIVYNLILSSDESLDIISKEKIDATKMGFTSIEYQRRFDPFLGLTSYQHSYYVNGIASGDLLIQHSIEN
jgi:hypothetical protein